MEQPFQKYKYILLERPYPKYTNFLHFRNNLFRSIEIYFQKGIFRIHSFFHFQKGLSRYIFLYFLERLFRKGVWEK